MKLADLATVRPPGNTEPIPVPRAIFGHCDCGTLTVWQEGEKPRYVCGRCLTKARLAQPSFASLLHTAEAILAPPPVRVGKAHPPTDGSQAEPLHAAEHLIGWEADPHGIIPHIRRHHLGKETP